MHIIIYRGPLVGVESVLHESGMPCRDLRSAISNCVCLPLLAVGLRLILFT